MSKRPSKSYKDPKISDNVNEIEDQKSKPVSSLFRTKKFPETSNNGQLSELDVNDVDNEYILTGFRVNYVGFGQVLKTIFYLHNETFNIWSHLIGCLVFLAIALQVNQTYPNLRDVAMSGKLVDEAATSSAPLNSFLVSRITTLNQELDQRASMSQSFNMDFYHSIENLSYLSAKNMAEFYYREQRIQDLEGNESVRSITISIQQLINNFKSFLINADTNASQLKDRIVRLTLIKTCL